MAASDSSSGGGLARRRHMDERTLRFIADADRRLQNLHSDSPKTDEEQAPAAPAPPRRPRPRVKVKPPKPTGAKAVFRDRVDAKVVLLSSPDHRLRAVYSPAQRVQLREVDRREAVWMPVWTVLTVVACAGVAIAICIQILGFGSNTVMQRAACGVLVVIAIAICVAILLRIQAHWHRLRPRGRVVPRDVADAYEVVRDAPELLANLGLPADRLGRVYDLLPAVEPLVDFLAQNAAASPGALRASTAYRQLIRAAAEVHVLIETCEERLGIRRRWAPEAWTGSANGATSATDAPGSLADLAELILPPQR